MTTYSDAFARTVSITRVGGRVAADVAVSGVRVMSLSWPDTLTDQEVLGRINTMPPSPPQTSRIIPAADFIERFTPAEIQAQQSDAILNAACLQAIAQGWVNLDSQRLTDLLAYAVSVGKLAAERVAVVKA